MSQVQTPSKLKFPPRSQVSESLNTRLALSFPSDQACAVALHLALDMHMSTVGTRPPKTFRAALVTVRHHRAPSPLHNFIDQRANLLTSVNCEPAADMSSLATTVHDMSSVAVGRKSTTRGKDHRDHRCMQLQLRKVNIFLLDTYLLDHPPPKKMFFYILYIYIYI